jgi:hypothetical protein
MHQRAALEYKDPFARVAVGAVLLLGVFDRLPGERVLELEGDDRDAVQAERQVENAMLLRAVRLLAIAQLARDAKDIGGVTRF